MCQVVTMRPTIPLAVLAIAIGILGAWQNEPLSRLARGWSRRWGVAGETVRRYQTARVYRLGAFVLILVGLIVLIIALAT